MGQRQRRLSNIKPTLYKCFSVCWDILDITRLVELGKHVCTMYIARGKDGNQ